MWLIDTSTFLLREFTRSAPPYAALSHVTEENEVLLGETAHPRREILKENTNMVEKACSQARTAGIAWLWNYATCVDKRSCAAQSEAINSLARIYRGCEYTIIYLADLVFEIVGDATLGERLAECCWMKDIWAIPQIIFSRAAYFFSSDWTLIGTKVSLFPLLSSIIGIDQPVLENSECLEDYSIARRMSWASEMTASRTEDFAYALLGLFDVSMPIIHGEGQRAYLKLQEEILKDTNDFSLLAWDNLTTQKYTGLFAPSPACFRRFKSGPTEPLRVNGEVQMHCAGIMMQINLWKSETGWLLPLQSEHGSFCSVPLILWDGRFVRKGSEVGWNLPESKNAESVRICFKRDVSVHISRKISTSEGTVSEKAFQELRPCDDTSITRRLRYSNVEYISEQGEFRTAPAVERSCQRVSTASNGVTPHEDMITDPEVASCLSSPYERNCPNLVKPHHGLVGKEDEQSMVTDTAVAPACTISSVLPSDPVYMVMGNEHDKTESSPSSAALSAFDRRTRPSLVHESTLEAHEVPEDFPIGGPETGASGSSYNRSLPAEVQVLDVASITEELTNIVFDKFRTSGQGQPQKRSFIPWQTHSRKRLKHNDASDQNECVYMSDSDDGETVLVKKTSFLACPFYVRNNQYTTCLKRHHFDNIEEVKEHICWDHRRPKFCPICKEEFSSGRDRDTHIRLRTCNANISTVPDGITDDQEEQLEREEASHVSEDSRWFQIWGIIFPQITRPPSAFYTRERDVSICAFRQFWMKGGEKVVADFLETKEYRSYNIRNEERNLRSIHDLVMDNVVDTIFDDTGAKH